MGTDKDREYMDDPTRRQKRENPEQGKRIEQDPDTPEQQSRENPQDQAGRAGQGKGGTKK